MASAKIRFTTHKDKDLSKVYLSCKWQIKASMFHSMIFRRSRRVTRRKFEVQVNFSRVRPTFLFTWLVLFGAYYKTRPNCRPDGVSGQKLIRDPSKLATRWEISSKNI